MLSAFGPVTTILLVGDSGRAYHTIFQ